MAGSCYKRRISAVIVISVSITVIIRRRLVGFVFAFIRTRVIVYGQIEIIRKRNYSKYENERKTYTQYFFYVQEFLLSLKKPWRFTAHGS